MHSLVRNCKAFIFVQIQSICTDLQPAPRARLLSLCTVTLESFRVSLSMALRRLGYSDWSIGYMPEGQKNTACASTVNRTLHFVKKKHRLYTRRGHSLQVQKVKLDELFIMASRGQQNGL